MHDLADEGMVLFAGPLAGSEHGRIRVLLIVNPESEAFIRDRLAADSWAQAQRLVTRSVEPWTLRRRRTDLCRLVTPVGDAGDAHDTSGRSNKQIAARLSITPKTAGNVEHIYTTIGATGRAVAGLFAKQHGLLPDE